MENVDDIAETIIDEEPGITESAIHIHEQERVDQESEEKMESLVDSFGRTFDPELHRVDENGEPLLTKKGLLRVQRGKGLKNSATPVGPEQGLGLTISRLLTSSASMLISPEWAPVKNDQIDEQLQLDTAFDEFFKSQGIEDIPPGIALVLAVGSYALPRFLMPETKTKIKSWFSKSQTDSENED